MAPGEEYASMARVSIDHEGLTNFVCLSPCAQSHLLLPYASINDTLLDRRQRGATGRGGSSPLSVARPREMGVTPPPMEVLGHF